MLEYLYTLKYDYKSEVDNPVISYGKLYEAADFYAIDSLKYIARMKLNNTIKSLFQASEVKNTLAQLPNIVEYIYERTPDGEGASDPQFRRTLVDILVLNAPRVLESSQDYDHQDFRELLTRNGEFAGDFAVGIFAKWKGFEKVKCPICTHIWAHPSRPSGSANCPACSQRRDDWGIRVVP